MSKKICFVRHGESIGNVANTHQTKETPLSEEGHEQAKVIAHRFKSIDIDVLLSSDYMRAYNTAEEISKVKNIPIESTPLLRELKLPSSIENKSTEDSAVLEIRKQLIEHKDDASWHFEDEENIHDLIKRAKTFWGFVNNRPEKSICAVTHGTFLRCMIGSIMFEDAYTPAMFQAMRYKMLLSNTAITECVYDEKHSTWNLKHWNDVSHLT